MPKTHLASTSTLPCETPRRPDAIPTTESALPRVKWEIRLDLERHRAETERLRVLVDFLARPIHAHGGSDPDPDIITAYNLAVEAALQSVRRSCSMDELPLAQ